VGGFTLPPLSDWADGVVMESFTKASSSDQPYGDFEYADPSYQKDGKKRYPLDSERHVRVAWSYIYQADNREPYTADQLSRIESRIRSAGKK
jgi:hypothetical protein